MVLSFRYQNPAAVSGTAGCTGCLGNLFTLPRSHWAPGRPKPSGYPLGGWPMYPSAGCSRLPLVEALGGPVLEARAEREPARRQHFLDLVERLATQVRGLQQLGLG